MAPQGADFCWWAFYRQNKAPGYAYRRGFERIVFCGDPFRFWVLNSRTYSGEPPRVTALTLNWYVHNAQGYCVGVSQSGETLH